MPTKTAYELQGLVRRILLAAGADDSNADRVAEGLVLSDLSGVETHGVHQLPSYVNAIKNGEVVPAAKPEVVKNTPSTALVKGNWTFGFVSAKYAMELAIEKARGQSIVVVSIVQVNHIGRLGEYAEMAASQGMVSLLWASGYAVEKPVAVPYGGSEPVLSTNPISIGVPAGDEPPMVLDFATTAVAGTKVQVAQRENRQLPPGSIVDKDGKPTTEPADLYSGGAQLPFGGHKGYALMLADEFLGRLFSGADEFAEAHRGGPYMRHQGATFIVFRADLFRAMADFGRGADELQRQVRAVPPAPGFDRVLVPGDPEGRARAERRQNGIPVPDKAWISLTDLAASLGVEIR